MHKPLVLAGRLQEIKARRFYLFGLSESEAGAERKRSLGLLLTPKELLHVKLKGFGLSSQIFQLLKTWHSKISPLAPAVARF